MTTDSQQKKAETFRQLHADGVLVLPNAWDAVSAALVAEAGAAAVATTSAAVSWAAGRGDGQNLTREQMIERVREIAAAVAVPVTADVEGGYGPAPEDVAATVEGVIGAGAIGVNLEDSRRPGGPLFDIAEQTARLRAAREAAARAGLPQLVINARTDVYLFGIGAPEGRFDDVVARAAAYAEAGADSLFVPGLLDLDALRELSGKSPLPINVMTGPGAPAVSELAAAGVRRVSLGPVVALAAYERVRTAARELLTEGTYNALAGALDFGAVEALLARPAGEAAS
ncbi:isocitrate lyase/phosphoenolpyruvate mutase family protein [Nocardia sp. CDC159]|uniref:Isocitrate lyase/phosphoenolpyruvate mutase family protein n=1 Tax=Nocardia pulmonis TaxID=2951408 RepID=A0A9X2E6R4_9NOCA|nr:MULTISPECIES: isocitrate lyase/phosphoenolpyruvate mutase family protein [Nocardia]MCM6774681.1 isocitrate lyase/phosphoenolpyruvate mutase family protein [Nocardia pulmonis]MCM6787254.1 isocitrate lyase/phosphoenolpyruvate mutase family protein [Nocardia sp. CDC159]